MGATILILFGGTTATLLILFIKFKRKKGSKNTIPDLTYIVVPKGYCVNLCYL